MIFVIVDMQNDFVDGSLAVPHAKEVITPIIRFGHEIERCGGEVVLTRDWHPDHHSSFLDQGGDWPRHCVQNTWGARIVDPIREAFPEAEIFSKGTEENIEQYSGYEAVGETSNEPLYIAASPHDHVWVAGLALDFCVGNTVFDFFSNGRYVTLLLDGTRPVYFVNGAQVLLRMGHFDQSNMDAMPLETALDWVAGP